MFVLIMVFVLLPVVLGTFAFYESKENYSVLIKARRTQSTESYIILGIWSVLFSIVGLTIVKVYGDGEVQGYAYASACILLALSLWWAFIEFPMIDLIKNNKYMLTLVGAAGSLVVTVVAQVHCDSLISGWSDYHSSEFLTAQLAMLIFIVPAVWFIGFWFLIMLLAFFPIILLCLESVKLVILSSVRGRGFIRLITSRRIRKGEVNHYIKKLALRTSVYVALAFVLQSLPSASLSYFGSEEFESFLKEILITTSYHHEATDCINVRDEDGIRIALLSRDRISLYQKGAEIEFSKGICEFSMSPLIRESTTDS
ncbi:hypothetical protein AB4582_06740 [Vibrio splendidus]|uniref:hypothetical protein n=1 Tax=Vibrio splendidus TaxID=29497 RepID=UPI000D3C3206|nr:hypothetical protein [Vibrio splendidus]PTP89151.1 hypothetical protein CWO02_16435 [Vibrio splendidus]